MNLSYFGNLMLEQMAQLLTEDIGPLEAQDDGSYSLRLESDLDITLRENPESGITIYTVLGPLPAEKREAFLELAMAANLFGRETGGSILGVDKEEKKLTLLTFLQGQMNYRDFHDTLEDFVNYADAWRHEAAEFEKRTVGNG